MAKSEWGVKRICRGCDISFYDMKRQPVQCPKCETVFAPKDQEKKVVKLPKKVEEKKIEKSAILDQEENVLSLDDSGDDVLLSEDLDEEDLDEEDLAANVSSEKSG
ncbi:MAG: hypothetical protein GY915_06685 [bacterium]|nr:hypothetical protein [bacterium]